MLDEALSVEGCIALPRKAARHLEVVKERRFSCHVVL